MRFLSRLGAWLCELLAPLPKSLGQLSRRRAEPALSKLYVLKVDFAVTKEKAEAINASLEPLRKKYGFDFIVLEPGMKLQRFEDV